MTQKAKLLQAFRNAPDQTLSMGYIERELYMSQGNSRLKDLKEDGYTFKDAGTDKYGFKLHKLIEDKPDVFKDMGITDKPIKLEFGNKKQLYEIRSGKLKKRS